VGVENDTFIKSAYNVHFCTQRWFLVVTVQRVWLTNWCPPCWKFITQH